MKPSEKIERARVKAITVVLESKGKALQGMIEELENILRKADEKFRASDECRLIRLEVMALCRAAAHLKATIGNLKEVPEF